jgi:DNA-directed RNA polymerase I, II, and III subunit RPABC1
MSSTGDKKTRLFRIRKTIGKMLNARGYMVGQAELDLGKDQFVEEHGEDPARANLTMQFPRRDDPADSIFVFFPDEEKVGVKTIKEYAKRMKDESVFRAIIVVQQSLTPFAFRVARAKRWGVQIRHRSGHPVENCRKMDFRRKRVGNPNA